MVCGNGGWGFPAMLPLAAEAPAKVVPSATPADLVASLCRNCLRETGSCGISVLLVADNQKCIIEGVPRTTTACHAPLTCQRHKLRDQAPAVGNSALYAGDLVYCC